MRKNGTTVIAILAMILPAAPSLAGGLVALQTGDPPCADDSGAVYVDCGNGTVTDNRTDLVWLKNTACLSGAVDWHAAIAFAAGLSDLPNQDASDCGLSDGSSAGEWRLASKTEWQAMVADAQAMACDPAVTDDQGTGCWTSDCADSGLCSFLGAQSLPYWAATTLRGVFSLAWVVNMSTGVLGFNDKLDPYLAWPVRGSGQESSGLAARRTADPSCADDSGAVYVDCGNGTVTDNRTGLVWLANADCFDRVDWQAATGTVAGLSDLPGTDPDDCGLIDGSSPGEWRLATKAELAAMIEDAQALSCDPAITDDAGTGCWSGMCNEEGACAFSEVGDAYWGTTTHVVAPTFVFAVSLRVPVVALGNKTSLLRVWPVRGGQ